MLVLTTDAYAFGGCDGPDYNSNKFLWYLITHIAAAVPVVGGIFASAWDDCEFSGAMYWMFVAPMLVWGVVGGVYYLCQSGQGGDSNFDDNGGDVEVADDVKNSSEKTASALNRDAP